MPQFAVFFSDGAGFGIEMVQGMYAPPPRSSPERFSVEQLCRQLSNSDSERVTPKC
jgi:hypothetical protein